ncbi:hypothetical protein ACFX15_021515 [Malus domestica]
MRTSQWVTHHGNALARTRLTSEFLRNPKPLRCRLPLPDPKPDKGAPISSTNPFRTRCSSAGSGLQEAPKSSEERKLSSDLYSDEKSSSSIVMVSRDRESQDCELLIPVADSDDEGASPKHSPHAQTRIPAMPPAISFRSIFHHNADAQPLTSKTTLAPITVPESDPTTNNNLDKIQNPNLVPIRTPGRPLPQRTDCGFWLIMPVLKVSSIIGRKGKLMKKMYEETRAHIRVLDDTVGNPDPIVLISAREEPEVPLSPAMEAVIRIFKCVSGLSSHWFPTFSLTESQMATIIHLSTGEMQTTTFERERAVMGKPLSNGGPAFYFVQSKIPMQKPGRKRKAVADKAKGKEKEKGKYKQKQVSVSGAHRRATVGITTDEPRRSPAAQPRGAPWDDCI